MIALVNLICGGLAAGLWCMWPGLGPWPLLLVAVGQVAFLLPARTRNWRIPLSWPLVLFLLTAMWGLWVAYDRAAAWPKFWLIVGGLALYNGFVHTPEWIPVARQGRFAPLRWVLGALPTVVAIYFLLTNDWTRWIGKLPWLDPAMRWFSAWQLNLSGYSLNPNVAGGVIAAFLPLQVAAIKAAGRAWLGILLVGVSTVGLLMSATRGAWLALGVVVVSRGLWTLSSRWVRRALADRRQRIRVIVWLLALLVVGLAVAFLLSRTPWGARLAAWIASDRLDIWRNSLDLASDYPFTGLGLGNFEMAYASYVLLTHVGYIFHAHNLLLDIWLEQGLLGLLAFGWLAASAVRSSRQASPWRLAALSALGVVLLHGLMDDAFYGYGGRAALLLFVPLAMLARPAEASAPTNGAATTRRGPGSPIFWSAVVLILMALTVPSIQAVFQANLGTFMQTRAELAVYRWPDWPIQDALRRSPNVNLGPAIDRYRAALALDPADVTANRRLGQIELSVGEYEAARRHLEAAYAAAPGQRATRQILGECYAAAGEVERAVALWRTVDVSQGQLVIRQWWYDYIGEQMRAAWVAQAAAGLPEAPPRGSSKSQPGQGPALAWRASQ